MSNTNEADALFKKRPDGPALSEYQREEESRHMNFERLRAERLAREAASKIKTNTEEF